MSKAIQRQAFAGLEHSCEGPDRILPARDMPGMERIEACFHGNAFTPHRHDTYAIGLTLEGVQSFAYRGARRFSLPGNIIVLHPDELHDGAAATEAGLRYRMLYLDPALIRRGLDSDAAVLPFLAEPVFADPALAALLHAALDPLDETLEELFVDDLLVRLARGMSRQAGRPLPSLRIPAARAATQARDFLAQHAARPVRSQELEAVTGLDRFELSRHFRAMFSTSPLRFLTMRRLERARAMIVAGEPLAEVAAASGFADQSHLTRQFKRAYGMTPGRWGGMVQAGFAQGRGERSA